MCAEVRASAENQECAVRPGRRGGIRARGSGCGALGAAPAPFGGDCRACVGPVWPDSSLIRGLTSHPPPLCLSASTHVNTHTQNRTNRTTEHKKNQENQRMQEHARDRLGIKDSCTCDEMKKDGGWAWDTGKKRQRRDGGLKEWRDGGMEGWR